MSAVGVASVRADLNLRLAETVQFVIPSLADQVAHLVGQGLSLVQIANRLGVSGYAAFWAGARICDRGDVAAVAASLPPRTEAEQAEDEAWAAWVAAHTLEEIAARFDVHVWTAGVMQDLANEKIENWNWGRA